MKRNSALAQYKREHPPDFVTHLNYVSYLNNLSKGLKLEYKQNIKSKIETPKNLDKKLRLIQLIKKSLDEEWRTVDGNPEFAEVCVPWIAVKAYYLFFNLLLILDYFVGGQAASFNSTHKNLLEGFKKYLDQSKVEFNKKSFNINFVCQEIKDLPVTPGANLQVSGVNLVERRIQILKKLVEYKLEDFKREKKFKDFKSKQRRQEKDAFLKSKTVNICEFFYWYRIKSNYRDLEFLDKDISDQQFHNFYNNYFNLTKNFYNALQVLINDLYQKRLGKNSDLTPWQ